MADLLQFVLHFCSTHEKHLVNKLSELNLYTQWRESYKINKKISLISETAKWVCWLKAALVCVSQGSGSHLQWKTATRKENTMPLL